MVLEEVIYFYGVNGGVIVAVFWLLFTLYEFYQIYQIINDKIEHEISLYMPLLLLGQLCFCIYGFYFDLPIFCITSIGVLLTPLIVFVMYFYGSKWDWGKDKF